MLEIPLTIRIMYTDSGSTRIDICPLTPTVFAYSHSVEVSSRSGGAWPCSEISVHSASTNDRQIAPVPIQPAARGESRPTTR